MNKHRRSLSAFVGRLSQRDAACRLGISRATLRARIVSAGIVWTRPPAKTGQRLIGRSISRAEALAVRSEAKALGYPVKPLPRGWRKQTAEALGISGDHVRQILKGQRWKDPPVTPDRAAPPMETAGARRLRLRLAAHARAVAKTRRR